MRDRSESGTGTTRTKRKAAAWLAVALAAATALAVVLLRTDRRAEPPNVVLLFIDTLRADRMGLYGHHRSNTPEIDRFAAGATTFERAYSPCSSTRNSFATYFTGLYPETHGCEGRRGVLAPGLTTLAERFKRRGYTTAGIYANYNIGPSLGFAQGFDLYDHPPANVGYAADDTVTDAAAVNERLLRWLRDERPDEPWFLFVLYIDPHDPYLPHAGMSYGEPPAPGVDGSRRFLNSIYPESPDPGLDAVQQHVRDLYDGEIAYVDGHVGRFLDELEALGLADETVVVLSADHGEGFWEHQQYRGHGMTVFEEEIHVPLVVRWPGRSVPGHRVRTPVAVLDFFGALAEAYDLAGPDEYQAGSWLDGLAGEPEPRPIFVAQKTRGVGLRCRIEWPWKLIQDDHDRKPFLFDLRSDPLEPPERAVSQGPKVDEMVSVLEAASEEQRRFREKLDLSAETPELTEQEKRGLRALGYAH